MPASIFEYRWECGVYHSNLDEDAGTWTVYGADGITTALSEGLTASCKGFSDMGGGDGLSSVGTLGMESNFTRSRRSSRSLRLRWALSDMARLAFEASIDSFSSVRAICCLASLRRSSCHSFRSDRGGVL